MSDRVMIGNGTRYEYNPACACEVCENGGKPAPGPSSGHSYCFAEPHIPPRSRPPWASS